MHHRHKDRSDNRRFTERALDLWLIIPPTAWSQQAPPSADYQAKIRAQVMSLWEMPPQVAADDECTPLPADRAA